MAPAPTEKKRARLLPLILLLSLLFCGAAAAEEAQAAATARATYTATFAPGGVSTAQTRQASPGVTLEVKNEAAVATTPESTTYGIEEKGPKDSLDYRVFFKAAGTTVSPWHDIPLYPGGDGLINFVCEIPKGTSAKMECATDEPNTPIKQDTKKGKLRFYPYNINWNYGFVPMTWEDPDHTTPELKAGGDNDPIDLVEIGSEQLKLGGVYKVKPLGIYALLDQGQVDWKVVCIRTDDPKAAEVNDVADVERVFPGELQKIMKWFRDYKTPDGKPQNAFGYDNKCMDRAFTLKVIEETHGFYNALKSGKRANDEELSLF